MENPLNIQVGGSHYKQFDYQPIEFCFEMGYDPAQFSMTKYLSRWQDKGGVEDLEKIKHYADLEELLGEGHYMTATQMDLIREFVLRNKFPQHYQNILIAITIGNTNAIKEEIDKIIESLK